MTRPKRPTLADVAKASGLSPTSVSLILNNRPDTRLSEDAVQRVHAAASALGYKANPMARGLRLGKTRTIGFISDQVTITRFASEMVRGTLREAREHEHTVLIAESGDEGSHLAESFAEMMHRQVDGILIGLMAARMIDVPASAHEVPVVIVNGRTPDDLPSVLPHEYAAGGDIAQVLLDAGHRKIGFVGNVPAIAGDPRRSVTIALRVDGIRNTLAHEGVVAREIDMDVWTTELGYQGTLRLLDEDPDITAIISGTDGVALGIYQALAELGLKVPQDMSVVSFDDEELARLVRPGLTTARLPYEQMARVGVDMLLGDRELSHELLPMPIISRNSVAAPRR